MILKNKNIVIGKQSYFVVVSSSNITTAYYYINRWFMERKSKVTQAAVNAACDQLQADNKTWL